MILTRILAAVCIFAFVSPRAERLPSLQTFTSPDGVFQFRYSPSLVTCKRDEPTREGEPGEWVHGCGLCATYDRGRNPIICVVYPRDDFKDKFQFAFAGFVVEVLEQGTTEQACFKKPDWADRDFEEVHINGIPFKFLPYGDPGYGMHIFEEGKVYRTYHHKKCYELGTRMGITASWVFEESTRRGPFKEFTKEDRNEVNSRLNEPIKTFKFLR